MAWTAYNFLILCALFALPSACVFALRPDLRKILKLTVPASIPFAATEFLFYPSYWRPKRPEDGVTRLAPMSAMMLARLVAGSLR